MINIIQYLLDQSNFYSRNKEDSSKLSGHYVEQSDIKIRASSDNTDDREDDACEESWSDEEGEDPRYTYNYSLRRRRYILIYSEYNISTSISHSSRSKKFSTIVV